jgi:hypothetical protein
VNVAILCDLWFYFLSLFISLGLTRFMWHMDFVFHFKWLYCPSFYFLYFRYASILLLLFCSYFEWFLMTYGLCFPFEMTVLSFILFLYFRNSSNLLLLFCSYFDFFFLWYLFLFFNLILYFDWIFGLIFGIFYLKKLISMHYVILITNFNLIFYLDWSFGLI